LVDVSPKRTVPPDIGLPFQIRRFASVSVGDVAPVVKARNLAPVRIHRDPTGTVKSSASRFRFNELAFQPVLPSGDTRKLASAPPAPPPGFVTIPYGAIRVPRLEALS
jgi:hypothetical protein